MKNRVKRIAFIVFILLMFFMFTGCVACAAPGDSSSLYNKNGVPFFSVGLEYSPEEREDLVGKYQTHLYIFHREEWEGWEKPGLEITFQFNRAGEIEIKKCEAFFGLLEQTSSPEFVITRQRYSIEGSEIEAAITGYPDYGSF